MGCVLIAFGSRLSSWRKSCTWVESNGVGRGRTRKCSGEGLESEYGAFVVPFYTTFINGSPIRLCLFIVNTIFAMQFNQILQITHEDSLIANRYVGSRGVWLDTDFRCIDSFDWHVGSHSPMDLALIASVQLRARFLHYKSLLEITAADADDLERTDKSHTATLLSLSILTRTSNQDLGNINAHWVEQIREGMRPAIPISQKRTDACAQLHLRGPYPSSHSSGWLASGFISISSS